MENGCLKIFIAFVVISNIAVCFAMGPMGLLALAVMGALGFWFWWSEYREKEPSYQNEVRSTDSSAWEDGVYSYVNRKYPFAVERHNRSIIRSSDGASMLEIDIWIPSLNLAIECDGEYWHDHSAYNRDRTNGTRYSEEMYKEKYCADHGIKLIHVWDSQSMSSIESDIDSAIRSARGW